MGPNTAVLISLLLFWSTVVRKADATEPFYDRTFVAQQPVCQTHQTESVLSGINIYRDRIDDIKQKLGEPTRTHVLESKYKTLRDYEWEAETWQMSVITVSFPAGTTAISSIDVWGERTYGEVGRTGQRAQLGYEVRDAYHMYRCAFNPLPFPINTLFLPSFKLSSDNTRGALRGGASEAALEIDFGARGTIVHMRLTNPCALNGCWLD